MNLESGPDKDCAELARSLDVGTHGERRFEPAKTSLSKPNLEDMKMWMACNCQRL